LTPRAADAEGTPVTTPLPRTPGVLCLFGATRPMQGLLDRLHQEGIAVDVATDLAEARRLFFGAGGHDCMVLGPDVRPGLARDVVEALLALDPDLALASFGPRLDAMDRPARRAVLASLHPSSRAGAGALLRFLRQLRLRC